MKEVIPLEKIKDFFRGLANLFKNMSDIVEYSETQKQTNKAISAINVSIEKVNSNMEKMSKKLDGVVEQTTHLENDMKKVKSGLQKELFQSLQLLREKYVDRGWATGVEKNEAKIYYDEIHNMGEDGWSDGYIRDIYELPESEKDYRGTPFIHHSNDRAFEETEIVVKKGKQVIVFVHTRRETILTAQRFIKKIRENGLQEYFTIGKTE